MIHPPAGECTSIEVDARQIQRPSELVSVEQTSSGRKIRGINTKTLAMRLTRDNETDTSLPMNN